VKNSFTNRLSGAFDFAVKCFLFIGGAYFLFYSVISRQSYYIPVVFILYLLGLTLRVFVFRTNLDKNVKEPGMFLLSALLLGYLLYIFNLDSNISNYLPDRVLLQSGTSFIFIIAVTLVPRDKSSFIKVIVSLVIIALFFVLKINQNYIDIFFQTHPWIAKTIIGTPIVYLVFLLSGAHILTTPNEKKIDLG